MSNRRVLACGSAYETSAHCLLRSMARHSASSALSGGVEKSIPKPPFLQIENRTVYIRTMENCIKTGPENVHRNRSEAFSCRWFALPNQDTRE